MGEVVIKLGASALAGVLLGVERESKHKPIGVRTCAVIAIASCLLTIVSMKAAFDTHSGEEFIRADPMRLAAQIISGVGFLGAGVILRRSNDVISGLTTAAIVWAAAGFGVAIGAGYFIEVAVALALLLLTVSSLPYVLQKIGPDVLREKEVRLHIYVDPNVDINDVMVQLKRIITDIKDLRIKGQDNSTKLEMRCILKEQSTSIFTYYHKIASIHGIHRTEIEGI